MNFDPRTGHAVRRPPRPTAPPPAPVPASKPVIDMTQQWIVEVIQAGADPEQLERYLQHLREFDLLDIVARNTLGRPHRAASVAWHCAAWAKHAQDPTWREEVARDE